MGNLSFSEIVILMTVYSIVGWFCESVFCSVSKKRILNKGFLKGPYCPIYGIGAILILGITYPVKNHPVLILIISILVSALLEYITSWLMEFVFQIRWWDYSKKKYNFHGRICLPNSLLLGTLGFAAVYYLQPLLVTLFEKIPKHHYRTIASAALFIIFIDLISTLSELTKFMESFMKIQSYFDQIDQYQEKYAWFQKENPKGSISRLIEISGENLVDDLNKLMNKQETDRLFLAFPALKIKNLDYRLSIWGNLWEDYKRNVKESWQKRIWKTAQRIGKKTVSVTKDSAKSFAAGISLYKLFWVFVIGSVLGYVVETIYCFISSGVFVSRQGLLYGPFSQIYGFGAIVMVLILTPLAKKSDLWLFLGGTLVGGAFEYCSSIFQEYVFGSVSWDYSERNFSLGGRTCLTYMFFWGILSVVFMKVFYPWLSHLIERMPNRQGRFFTWLLLILLTVDLFLTTTALLRWTEREKGAAPLNAYEAFLDERYPNKRMQEIFPNMQLLSKQGGNFGS